MKSHQTYYKTLDNPTVAETFLYYLKSLEGVDTVFGVPGKGVEWFLDAMDYSESGDAPADRRNVHFIICRHDGSASFMADGYARVSGKLGVCLVTSGPGASNAVTGVMCAQVDSSAVMVVTGEVAEADFGRGAFQEGADSGIDIVKMYESVTEYSMLVSNASNFQTILTQAIRTATAEPRRAVHIAVPTGIAGQTRESVKVPMMRRNYVPEPAGADAKLTQETFSALRNAQRPLILVGSGARHTFLDPGDRSGSADRLENFLQAVVEKWGIPVMTTPRAKGVVPERHPMSLRNYGMAACAWPQYYMKQAEFFPQEPPYDCLVVLGSQLKQWATNAWNPMLVPDGPLIQVDLDPTVIARGFPVEHGIVGNCTDFVEQLSSLAFAADPNEEEQACIAARKTFVADTVKSFPAWESVDKRASDAVPVLPQRLMADLQVVLDNEPRLQLGGHVVIDTGNTMGWTWSELVVNPPVQIWYNTGMGSMGWGNGAGIGAKVADPERPVIIITGDGGFLMNGKEISTAYAHNLGVVWIVFDDNNLLMVSQGMGKDFPDPPRGHDSWYDFYKLGNADLVQFSRSLGADAIGTDQPGALTTLLPEALRRADKDNRPQVIVVKIDHEEAPAYPAPPPLVTRENGGSDAR